MTTFEPAADNGSGLVRVRMNLAYDGTNFAGWARQPRLRTVQGCVETALAAVLRAPEVRVTCAGRTDAGVHARGQVLHCDLSHAGLAAALGRSDRDWGPALASRLNGVLDHDVRVRDCVEAPPGFDARFAALWRRYAYRVCDDTSAADPLVRGHVWMQPSALDLDSMNAAAARLEGTYDFAAYCRAREGASTIRHLQVLRWERDLAGLAVLHVRADAFCHHMVRGLAGALVSVGQGRRPVSWPGELLAVGQREPTVVVAPAHGLILEEVGYPPDEELTARAAVTRARR